MNMHRPSCVIGVVLIVIQVVGPATLWALDERGIRVEGTRRAVVSGLTGGELTATSAQRTAPVHFSEAVEFGEAVRTEVGTTAEVLVNQQALVTLLGESQVRLEQEGANTLVYLTKGDVLLSVAASRLREGQTVIVETPTARVRTTGGVLHARVGLPPGQAELSGPWLEARPQRVAFSSATPVATGPVSGESFEVLEGTMQVAASTPGATPITVPAGQGIQSTGGLLGLPTPLASVRGVPPHVLAVVQHGNTPSTGLAFVTRQQMTQVGALQQALFSGAEAVGEEGQKKSAQKAIIATLFNTSGSSSGSGQGRGPNALFGSGSPYGAALLNAINRQGSGVGDDNDDTSTSLNSRALSADTQVPGGLGLVTFTKGADGSPSAFTGTELLLVDGGSAGNAPHGGRAPVSSLVARAVTDKLQYQIPKLLEINNPAEASTTVNLRTEPLEIVDVSALTFQPYEVHFKSFSSDVDNSALGKGVFEIKNLGTGQTTTQETEVFIRRESLAPNFDPEPVNVSGFLRFDGLVLHVVLDKLDESNSANPLAAGQAFRISEILSTPIKVNGNTGLDVGTNYRNQSSDPSVPTVDQVPTVIVRSPGDNGRFIVGGSPDTRDPAPAGDAILGDFSSRSDRKVCANCDSFNLNEEFSDPSSEGLRKFSYVDGRVTASSASGPSSPVTLSGGVVLADATRATISSSITRGVNPWRGGDPAPSSVPSATKAYFERQRLTPGFDGSVAAIVANDNSPAFVRIQDRVVAVIGGSSIQPEKEAIRTALLSVLDSQLIGPTTTPTSLVGAKLQEEDPRVLEGGVSRPHRANNEIPPLLEINDSTVNATAALVVRATSVINQVRLDRALLEATSPVLAMLNGQMTATGHLIDLAGATPIGKGLLTANLVPGDALVRLNHSSLTIGGHLMALANGATATVNGALFSLANGSALTINGVLVSLMGNSVLNLNGDTFGHFGADTNRLQITNTLCNAGCTTIPGYPELRVAGGGSIEALPEGFVPFRLEPGGVGNLVGLDNPQTALFEITPGSQLTITVPPLNP